MSVSPSVSNRLPVFSGHPPKTPPIELKSNQNTRGGQGKAAKIYSGRNSFKKKGRKLLWKKCRKTRCKMHGNFHFSKGGPLWKWPKIAKNREKSWKSGKSRVHGGSHWFYRVHMGPQGYTRVWMGAYGFSRVHLGSHGCKIITWSLRAQRGSLPGPTSLYYKNAMSVCQSVRQSVRNRLPVFSGHPP